MTPRGSPWIAVVAAAALVLLVLGLATGRRFVSAEAVTPAADEADPAARLLRACEAVDAFLDASTDPNPPGSGGYYKTPTPTDLRRMADNVEARDKVIQEFRAAVVAASGATSRPTTVRMFRPSSPTRAWAVAPDPSSGYAWIADVRKAKP